MRSLLLALAVALVLAPRAAPARSLADIDFTIKKGNHDASGEGVRAHMVKIGKRHDRRVSFKVLFTSSAAYQTASASHQSDSNKVMGISILRIHEDSVRLGWAFDPKTQKMQLRFYAWVNGTHDNRELVQVPLNQWVDVELTLNDRGMTVRAAGVTQTRQADLGWKGLTTTSILRTAYFGGVETAPKDITVKVKDISAD